ncbi:methionyl-tRNA formyltransferase, putative [Trypanosoma cruzi marinkellei]|uniref:Methionyl-tRNA formyltransferase, putative n=1 Tax=Trypanosoma cruzi marinkellei TaxID=85056 RepID=K2MDN3_TRYCR|nr:methionyl-tRNA formyltransferase, putative [Trypanosoma cruzi marinkellei]
MPSKFFSARAALLAETQSKHGVRPSSTGAAMGLCATLLQFCSFRYCYTTPVTAATGSRGGSHSTGHVTESGVPKTPSIIFFGGDIVSLVALKMLREQLECIWAADATSTSNVGSSPAGKPHLTKTAEGKQQLVVVCPFLPADPSDIFQHHHRQYPVARYCVEHAIPLIPVDHPTSLARSGTLQHILCPWNAGEQGTSLAKDKKGEAESEYILGQPLEAFDVAVVVSFRYFLPKKLLERLPRTINLHPSLLPRYRGASPIFAPLLRGDDVGGTSLIKLSLDRPLMDSGDILWQQSVPIPHDMTIREYLPLVTKLGATGLCECLFGGPSASVPAPDLRRVGGVPDAVTETCLTRNCDWPRTFDARWASAWPQNYDVHFTRDPYHAPVLPKDRVIIRWHAMTAEEAYGTWRAFVGGEYHSPTVNATFNKGATPVRQQLLERLRTRAAREMKKKSRIHQQCDDGVATIRGTDEQESDVGSPLEKVGATKKEFVGMEKPEVITSTAEVRHHHLLQQKLLVGCTFTDALHPRDIPIAVVQELQQLEKGKVAVKAEARYQQHQQQEQNCVDVHIEPGSVYFPETVEDMCAVKCREGWFVWRAAALKGSTAQPAGLLRKGMAMKTGVLYAAVFVESATGEKACPAVRG